MKEVILWLFQKVSDFVTLSLSWKIYGDFSLTHFILGAMFIFAIFRFLGFGADNYGAIVDDGFSTYKNAENRKEKQNYIHYLETKRYKNSYGSYNSITSKFRVNKKTGEVERL